MNTKTINIANKEETLEILEAIKNKNYGNVDVRINNVHLKELNKLVDKTIFSKNDAFISAETLWAIMQSRDQEGKHHGHNLTTEDVASGLRSITEPNLIVKRDSNRVAIVTLFISSFGEPLMFVTELNAGLVSDQDASINKIVTVYPKGDVSDLLKDKDLILFQK